MFYQFTAVIQICLERPACNIHMKKIDIQEIPFGISYLRSLVDTKAHARGFLGMRVTVMPNDTAKRTYFIFRSIRILVSTVRVPTPPLKVNFVFINYTKLFFLLIYVNIFRLKPKDQWSCKRSTEICCIYQ